MCYTDGQFTGSYERIVYDSKITITDMYKKENTAMIFNKVNSEDNNTQQKELSKTNLFGSNTLQHSLALCFFLQNSRD